MATYRANVTDKQQVDLENALNDSAIRVQWFDGKEGQVGQTKFVAAFDMDAQSSRPDGVSSQVRQFSGSGLCLGSHNDKPARFETPGKA
jgi:hypothetical protein